MIRTRLAQAAAVAALAAGTVLMMVPATAIADPVATPSIPVATPASSGWGG